MTYRTGLVAVLASCVGPAFLLCLHYYRRFPSNPQSFLSSLWNGPEKAILGAFTLDGVRRLWLVTSGYPVVYPGAKWAAATYFSLGLMSFALWGQVIQVARTRARNKDLAQRAAVLIPEGTTHKEQDSE